MRAASQYRLFSEALFHRMEADGFQKRNRSTVQKKQGSSLSQLLLYTNKLRGRDAIRQTYVIRQSFPEVDRVIYYLRNEYFSSQWATGRVWLCALMPEDAKTSGLPNATPNGYTHYLDDNMDIALLVEEVYDNIRKYAYPFFAAYPSPRAVLAGVEEQRPEFRTWAVHGNDLFQLACYLLFGEKEKALAFCERRMAQAQCEGARTAITQEILNRVERLSYGLDGKLLVPPRPADAKVR